MVSFSCDFRRVLRLVSCAAAIALVGCGTYRTSAVPRALRPLSAGMMAQLEQKHMPKQSPILIRLFKEESELEVWKQDTTTRFALLKTYPICRWSGELGPKRAQGDRQAPEGFYTITPAQMNPNSNNYLAFDIGYPNAYDRALGRTGSDLMVHGGCSSAGCYAMTDEQIAEIYALARESFVGDQRAFQVQAYPFRMTPLNIARHRDNPNMPFWRMLKEGNDHFEVTHLEPTVDVCEGRYVFDAQLEGTLANDMLDNRPGPWPSAHAIADGNTTPHMFNPDGWCAPYQVPQDIAAEVGEKSRRDEIEIADLARIGTPTVPVRTEVDGGKHPVFQ
jgi:murein L,D-transpeptidase YafK